MIASIRVALLVIALAMLAGAIGAAWQRDVPWAILYFALAATCGVLERIAEARGR